MRKKVIQNEEAIKILKANTNQIKTAKSVKDFEKESQVALNQLERFV